MSHRSAERPPKTGTIEGYPPVDANAASSGPNGMTILVVDDNVHNREVAEGHLVGFGYGAIQAESGERALSMVMERRPDLILLDVLMPGMDGFETCRRLRALPQAAGIPILFLTALGDLGTHKAALDSGADDFLTKPINRTELLIRVRSLLRIKELSDELKRNYEVIRSQRDALLEAQRQKEELTALIIHDLKNPLSSILSNVQYCVAQKSLGDDERESLRDVLRASQSMVRMVMNLLDISRSEDGALVPRMSEFELGPLLEEVCSEMSRRIEDKSQKLALRLGTGVRVLNADRDLVRRILENLIDNAYKYGPRQGTIGVDAVAVPTGPGERGGVIEIRIRDEGEGIPPPFRQKIFEKYARIDGRAAHEVRNSHGLGLVFCRRAVDVHGGRIWVEENTPHGSCFIVRLEIQGGSHHPPTTGSGELTSPSPTRPAPPAVR